jgi:hypothetical protein
MGREEQSREPPKMREFIMKSRRVISIRVTSRIEVKWLVKTLFYEIPRNALCQEKRILEYRAEPSRYFRLVYPLKLLHEYSFQEPLSHG